jgi:hypothetical protein
MRLGEEDILKTMLKLKINSYVSSCHSLPLSSLDSLCLYIFPHKTFCVFMGRSKPRTNKRPPPKPARPPTSPPPSTDPDLTSALHTWSTSALGRLDALPKLTQSQLSAIAGAAAGVGDPQGNLPIDLPASLAALFEAKLTLDREKAKLMRMQKELKGYREGVAAVSAGKGKEVAEECTCGRQ